MKIIAFPLYEHAAVLRPVPEQGAQTGEIAFAGLGFDLLCPQAFEATWNGGPNAEDVEIICTADASQGFVQSGGEGRLMFHPGIQFKTESDQVLWARGPSGPSGPSDAPKDGLAPLETMIDSSVLPCTLTLSWRFTRPGQAVHFAAGEPFCRVLPYPKSGLQEVALEVVRPDDEDAFAWELQRMIDAPALAGVFERLGKRPGEGAPADPAEIPFPPPFHVIAPPRALPAERIAKLFRGDYPARISVILPATNESVLLRRTVEQFEATLPAGSEILVIDNGSTDGCADFLVEEPREAVQLIRTSEPLGVAAARNHGLARARGEIVVFADAHIDLPEAWWQPIADTLNRPEVGVVGPGIGTMGKPGRGAACGQRIAEPTLQLKWMSRQGDEPCPVPTLGGGFMAMRHDTLKRAGAFDESMAQWGSEDMELCLRYWLLGYEAWVVPEVTVLHYFRKQRPYGVDFRLITHNLLRVALLHFNTARIGRVISSIRNHPRFGPALAMALESDVWEKRADFAVRRVRDDDWLFEKFSDCCHV
jgi:glycosyltransferase involved in cell wall biosynthesis